MPKFPAANYKQISRAAKKLGFYCARKTKGSHEVWRRDKDGRQTTIPNHGNEPLKRKTLASIFEDLGISAKDFTQNK